MIVLTIGADVIDTEIHISPAEKIALNMPHLNTIDGAELVRIVNV